MACNKGVVGELFGLAQRQVYIHLFMYKTYTREILDQGLIILVVQSVCLLDCLAKVGYGCCAVFVSQREMERGIEI